MPRSVRGSKIRSLLRSGEATDQRVLGETEFKRVREAGTNPLAFKDV